MCIRDSKEGKLDLPDPSSVSTVQSTGGLLSGMLSSSSSGSTGAEKNSDGTVTCLLYTSGRDSSALTPLSSSMVETLTNLQKISGPDADK